MSDFDHKGFLKTLTTRPGVYQMYDAEGKLLYVGKARNLKNRVGSYFRASGLTEKTMALVARMCCWAYDILAELTNCITHVVNQVY